MEIQVRDVWLTNVKNQNCKCGCIHAYSLISFLQYAVDSLCEEWMKGHSFCYCIVYGILFIWERSSAKSVRVLTFDGQVSWTKAVNMDAFMKLAQLICCLLFSKVISKETEIWL